eukprot:g16295.t1
MLTIIPVRAVVAGAAAEERHSRTLSLSAEDLVMAAHKASSRRVEVLSRTTGNVDQMVACYEQQLELLALTMPNGSSQAGLSVSTAAHAASVGEERFKKGDCRGASRLLRLALQALGGADPLAGEGSTTAPPAGHAAAMRRTLLFSLAHCCSKSGEHNHAIRCIKQLEVDGLLAVDAGGANAPSSQIFLFAKCKVLADAGDLAGAFEAAESLVAATPTDGVRGSIGTVRSSDEYDTLDLATARMMCSLDGGSYRSLGLLASIVERFPGTPKAFDARVALLTGLAAAARLRSQGPGLGRRLDANDGERSPPSPPPGTGRPVLQEGVQTPKGTSDAALGLGFGFGSGIIGPGADERASAESAERAERVADAVVEAALEVLVTFAEIFQGHGDWEACARWCGRAIALAEGLSNRPSAEPSSASSNALFLAGSNGGLIRALAGSGGGGVGGVSGSTASGRDGGAVLLLMASLLTLRGEMECRMGDFTSSSRTLDQALAECPTYERAREVAFWSAACDPGRNESSLSARLSALTGPHSGLAAGAARQRFLAKCVGLAIGATASAGDGEGGRGRGRRTDNKPEQTSAGATIPATPTMPSATRSDDCPNHDSRVTMVQERLLEALLLSPPAPAAATVAAQESPTATEHDDRGRASPTTSVPMDVDVGVDAAGQGAERVCETADDEAETAAEGRGAVPTALQVLASMVDSALQRSERGHGGDQEAGVASVLSRVLLSIDKVVLSAASLGISPSDDPDLDYLSKGCWNLAVRCCGPECDLPWADGAGSSARKDRAENVHGAGSRRTPLLALAPAFFKASRNWTELRSDANVAEAYKIGSGSVSKDNGSSESKHDMLERARKEVEVATGLNRELSSLKPEIADEMRSILLVAEMSVLGRLRDAVAVRSLVASREPDFQRCSTTLLQYCVQLAEDMLDDAKSIAGLCRLCIRRCLEDDPVDTHALGSLYRRLLLSASSREEALLVVDDFTARARDLQEGTAGIPSEDVDYMAAKCYNLGLQLMEMGLAGEAERFVGKALGLVKLGSSRAFATRWEETMYQVYRTSLQLKGEDRVPAAGGGGISPRISTSTRGEAFGRAREPISTGLFPIPAGAAAAGQAL